MSLSPDRQRALEANIPKYYLLRILLKRLVWPILTLFLLRNQLNAEQIGIIFSVGTIIGLILQVPTGVIADRIGRRQAIFVSLLGQAASMLMFYLGHSFVVYLLANALYYGMGSLMSGTHEAMMYETLGELGREKEIKVVTGRALFISQVVTGVLFTLVPVLAKYALRLPFLLNTFVFAAAAIFALSLTEPKRFVSISEKRKLVDPHGLRHFFSNQRLLLVTLFFSVIGSINAILESFRQVYLDVIHLDLAYFGLVYLGLRLATGLAGITAERLEKRMGRAFMLTSLPLITFISYTGLFLLNSFYGLLFVFLDGFQDGFSRPMEQEYLNTSINHASRATLISIYNFSEGILEAGLIPIAGYVIAVGGIHAGFFLAAVLVIVFGLPLLIAVLRQNSMPKLTTT